MKHWEQPTNKFEAFAGHFLRGPYRQLLRTTFTYDSLLFRKCYLCKRKQDYLLLQGTKNTEIWNEAKVNRKFRVTEALSLLICRLFLLSSEFK